MVREFINQYGMTIVYALLTAIAGFIGAQIKRIYEDKVNTEQKKKVVETCCKAVEQLYHDMSGAEKKEAAKTNILQMLAVKGIDISEIELEMLIEGCVAEFNFNFMGSDAE